MMTDEILDVKIVKLDICRYISIVVFIVFFLCIIIQYALHLYKIKINKLI